jgi:pimeloyl-ACP methyl ester carboxylesterase
LPSSRRAEQHASKTGISLEQATLVQEKWVTLDGAQVAARMRYLRAGSGPPLLLIHGLLGYSFSWRFVIPALAQRHTVFAPDMPGAGFSDRPVELDCSIHACAQRLLSFMDKAGVDSCDLLGTSHGGAVAMKAAALAPSRVRRLILVAPVNPWSAHGKGVSWLLSRRLVTALFLQLGPRIRVLDEFYLRRVFGDPRRIPPDSLDGYRAPLVRPGFFEYPLNVLRSWNRDLQELKSILPRIAHIPTLLIWGSLDAAVDPASAASLKKHFNNGRLLTMEGVGHLPYEEVPEEFNRAVSEFLSDTSR